MSDRAIALFLVLLTVCAFAYVLQCDFVNVDDTVYVTDNARVRSGMAWDNIVWAFRTTHANFWHPLTTLSHMLDCQLYGLDARWHHATNLWMHLLNTVLLFFVLKNMTGSGLPSAAVAALFAVHPLHVESVAWVSQRKDVWSTMFWILTMGAYAAYARDTSSKRKVALVYVLYGLGLMAKPMLVTLPLVLLLLDYWPLGRSDERWKLLKEKIPLIAMSFAAAVGVAAAQQSGGALRSLDQFPAWVRAVNSVWSYGMYLAKTFWPAGLSVFYPHPGETIALPLVSLVAIALAALTVAVLMLGRRYRYLVTGWFWYLVTLVPVIGWVQVGNHAMADRYTYVSLTGIFIALAWGAREVLQRWRMPRIVPILAGAAVLASLTAVTRAQTRHWHDSVALFEHALSVTRNNWFAHNNLGNAKLERGDIGGAKGQYIRALQIQPDDAWAHNNLGYALAESGSFGEAVAEFKESLRLSPGQVKVIRNLAYALVGAGDMHAAIALLADAVAKHPRDADLRLDMGLMLARAQRDDEARPYLQEAVRLHPGHKPSVYQVMEMLDQRKRGHHDR